MKKNFTLFLACLCACSVLFASNDTIRILGIGNSFTMDAMEQHLQPIMTGEGQPVILLYPYRGGTLFSQHDQWKNRTDTFPYNHCEFRDGVLKKGGDQSANLLQCVQEEPWDYIVFQTDHSNVGRLKSYDPYLSNLISFAKTNCSNKDVQLYLYMTWAFDSVSNYSAFDQYGKNTNTMYDSIRNAVSTVMKRHSELKLIPVGTAIQNGRTSYMGHRFNRDGYHLNYDHGRYIASLTWVCSLLGYNPDSVVYQPSTISNYCAQMCRAAVKGAIATPYDTTSLRADFGKSESESQPADESRLQRVTFNGLNIPIVEGQYEYTIPVVAGLASKVSMYSYPISSKAEQNIVDEVGSDVPRDPDKYGYFPLNAPALGKTVTYTNHVIAEDLIHTTTYVYHMVGVNSEDIVYTIGSKADLDDFAAVVNGGQYGANAKVTNDVMLNMQKQECWKTPIGTFDHPYTGTFDGQGYTLSGFNIYSSEDTVLYAMKALGLFGAIKDATIKNLTLTTMDECYFTRSDKYTVSNEYCGVLCGWMCGSTISNCHLIASVFTNVGCACGAICGYELSDQGKQSTIDRCCVEGAWRVRYKSNYGAFLGYAYNVNISNSYSLATMELQKDQSASIGGFIGYMNPNSDRHICFSNCYFAGKVSDERVNYGCTTNQTIYLGAITARCKGANAVFENVHYLASSAPAAFGLKEGAAATAVIDTCSKANLTDGTLCAKLGSAFTQGKNYPIIGKVEPAIVERFSPSNEGWTKAQNPAVVKKGDLFDWNVFYTRRKATDVLANGQRGTWFSKEKLENVGAYLQAADSVEGGIKRVSFAYNKLTADTAIIRFTVTVNDSVNQVDFTSATPKGVTYHYPDYTYSHDFLCKKNAMLRFDNSKQSVIVIGDIAITPYLRYIVKEDSVYATSLYYDCTRSDILINNTEDEGEVIYSIVSDETGKASISDGVINLTNTTQSGTIRVKASWNDDNVHTFFTLKVLKDIVPTVLDTTALVERFSKVTQTKNNDEEVTWQGDYADWQVRNVRRSAKDTLNGGAQGSWCKSGGYFKTTTQGGIKRLRYEWRQFVTDTVVDLVMAMSAGEVWKDTARIQSVPVQAASKNFTYDSIIGCKQDVALSLVNISPASATSKDRFLLGDMFITPYIYIAPEDRLFQLEQTVGSFDMRTILLDNTDGEGEIVYSILSDGTNGATISGSKVDFSLAKQSGDIQVQVSWNDGKVKLTPVVLRISVAEEADEFFTETFARCTKTQMTGTTYVTGDDGVFGWNLCNFTRQSEDMVGDAQGIQLNYGGSIKMNGAQEGGVKCIRFDYRRLSMDLAVKFSVLADGTEYPVSYAATPTDTIQQYTYAVNIDHNTLVGVQLGAKTSPAQSQIVVGPISIAPYLLFRQRQDTVLLDSVQTYKLEPMLINNTRGSGDITYSIVQDETGAASIRNSIINLSKVTRNGWVKVQATWQQVSTTISLYALYSATALPQINDSAVPHVRKILHNGQLVVLKDDSAYTITGLQINVK